VADDRELSLIIRARDFFTAPFKKLAEVVRGAKAPLTDLGREADKAQGFLGKLFSRFVFTPTDIVGAFRLIKNAIGDVVGAAAEQEAATARLNEALRQTGQFSQAASRALQDNASALQRETVFSDEAISSVQQLLIQFGHLAVDQVPQATKAVLGLASAKKIDLASAATIVSKALAGQATALERMGIQIDATKTGTELYAEVMQKLIPLYGQALAEANTFAGGLARIKNLFGEQLETIGFAIIKNKEFAKSLDGMAQTLSDPALANGLAAIASSIVTLAGKGAGELAALGRDLDRLSAFIAQAVIDTQHLDEASVKAKDVTVEQRAEIERIIEARRRESAGRAEAIAAANAQVEAEKKVTEALREQEAVQNQVTASLLGAAENAAKTLGVTLNAANASFIREDEIGKAIQAFTVLEGLFQLGKIDVDAYRVAQENLDKVLRGEVIPAVEAIGNATLAAGHDGAAALEDLKGTVSTLPEAFRAAGAAAGAALSEQVRIAIEQSRGIFRDFTGEITQFGNRTFSSASGLQTGSGGGTISSSSLGFRGVDPLTGGVLNPTPGVKYSLLRGGQAYAPSDLFRGIGFSTNLLENGGTAPVGINGPYSPIRANGYF